MLGLLVVITDVVLLLVMLHVPSDSVVQLMGTAQTLPVPIFHTDIVKAVRRLQ